MARVSLGSAVWTLEADATPLALALRKAEGIAATSSARIDGAFRRISGATFNTDRAFGALKLTAGQTAIAFRSLGEVMALTNSVWLNSIRNAGELVVALARMATEAKAAKVATEAVAAISTEPFVTRAFQSQLYAPFDPTTLKHDKTGRFAKGTGAGPGRDFASRQQMAVLGALAEMERTAPKIEVATGRMAGAMGRLGSAARATAAAVGITNLTLGTLVTTAALVTAAFAAGYYGAKWYINTMGGVAETTKQAQEQTEKLTEALRKRDAAMRKTARDQLRDSQNRIEQLKNEAFEEQRQIDKLRGARMGGPEGAYLQSTIPDLEHKRDQTTARMQAVEAQLTLTQSRLNRTWKPDTVNSINAEIASLRNEYAMLADKLPRIEEMISREVQTTADALAEAERKSLEQRLDMHNDFFRARRQAEEAAQKELDDLAVRQMDRRALPSGSDDVARTARLMSGLASATAYAGIRNAQGAAGPIEDKQLSEQKRTNALLMQLVRARGGLRN